jgi:hypothetical protein
MVALMSKEFRDNTRYKGTANAVATTWVVSFSQIRERDAAAADLLAFMSCVDWKAIPRSLLLGGLQVEEAIGTLCVGTLSYHDVVTVKWKSRRRSCTTSTDSCTSPPGSGSRTAGMQQECGRKQCGRSQTSFRLTSMRIAQCGERICRTHCNY